MAADPRHLGGFRDALRKAAGQQAFVPPPPGASFTPAPQPMPVPPARSPADDTTVFELLKRVEYLLQALLMTTGGVIKSSQNQTLTAAAVAQVLQTDRYPERIRIENTSAGVNQQCSFNIANGAVAFTVAPGAMYDVVLPPSVRLNGQTTGGAANNTIIVTRYGAIMASLGTFDPAVINEAAGTTAAQGGR